MRVDLEIGEPLLTALGESSMTKWEYQHGWTPSAQLDGALEQRGREGGELVSVIKENRGGIQGWIMFWKRRVEK